MTIAPIVMSWREADVIDPSDGTIERRRVMVPIQKYRPRADRQYEADADYTLTPVEARSRAAHSAYFAQLNECYGSLPEKVSARWESVEHFRKWVLIETGFFIEKEFTFEGYRAEQKARMLAAFIRTEDEYARMWVTCVHDEDSEQGMIEAGLRAWNRAETLSPFERMRSAIKAAIDAQGRGAVWKVIIRKAKSQDHASMKNEDFKASSRAVLDFASDLLGTRIGDVRRFGGRSA